MNMTKLKISMQVFFSVLTCCLLCACQANNTKSIVQEQNNVPEHEINIQAYLPIVSDIDIEDATFSLIFLDNDTIPELVVLDRYLNKYSVYTIKNDSAVCLIDSITTVEMSYFEKQNIISTFNRWNGGGDEGGYANKYYQLEQYSEPLTDMSIPSFEITYNAVYDINGEWTGDGITEYYKKGERIDETTYNQIFVDFNISQNDDVSCFSESIQHFTKDEIKDQTRIKYNHVPHLRVEAIQSHDVMPLKLFGTGSMAIKKPDSKSIVYYQAVTAGIRNAARSRFIFGSALTCLSLQPCGLLCLFQGLTFKQ